MKRSSQIMLAAVLIATAVLCASLFIPLARPAHRLKVKCYFQDAQGLREGADVRMAGVRVGTVTGVRVRPEMHSAEVSMELGTPYELKVPSDAVATVETAGILGESFVQIDIRNTSGPPINDGGVLKTKPGSGLSTKQWLDCLSNLAAHKPCDLTEKTDDRGSPQEKK